MTPCHLVGPEHLRDRTGRRGELMENREEERKGSGGAAAGGGSAPGANLRDLVSREYYGHKKKVTPLNASATSHHNFFLSP